jgi:hypothetical protein
MNQLALIASAVLPACRSRRRARVDALPRILCRQHPQPAHTRRAYAHLKNGGTLEKAAAMANHASTRTTQLYDRRRDEFSLDEVERIVI